MTPEQRTLPTEARTAAADFLDRINYNDPPDTVTTAYRILTVIGRIDLALTEPGHRNPDTDPPPPPQQGHPMTDHLTAARQAVLDAQEDLVVNDPSRHRLTDAVVHLDAALADAEPDLPEGWVSVRVPLSPTTQHNLLEDTPTRSWKSLWTRTRAALVDAYPHPEPERPLQPGDIVWWAPGVPGPTRYVYRVEAAVHELALITASDDGHPLGVQINNLVRVDVVPDSVDRSWHDANPIGDTE